MVVEVVKFFDDLDQACIISCFVFLRYSDSLDAALENLLSEANSKERRRQIKHFIDLTLTSIQRHVIAKDSSNLVLALHHRLGKVRKAAFEHMVETLDSIQVPVSIHMPFVKSKILF